MKLKTCTTLMLSATLLLACTGNHKPTPQAQTPSPQETAAPIAANDFPTLTRVEYVLNCMKEQGGKNYDNLYHCVCAVDHVAAQMSHEEFLQAQTFATNLNMAGERGGVFRDPPQSKILRDKLQAATTTAQAVCFPKGVKTAPDNAK